MQYRKVQKSSWNELPPPSQNSHVVRWHCTAESEQRVAEIKSWFLCRHLIGPNDSTATGWEMWLAWMFEYFAVLRAASSSAEPASWAAATTYESANGQMIVIIMMIVAANGTAVWCVADICGQCYIVSIGTKLNARVVVILLWFVTFCTDDTDKQCSNASRRGTMGAASGNVDHYALQPSQHAGQSRHSVTTISSSLLQGQNDH